MTSPLANQPEAGPYGSARNLPSFQEMFEQLQGAKLLTRFVARQERPRVLQIDSQLKGFRCTIPQSQTQEELDA